MEEIKRAINDDNCEIYNSTNVKEILSYARKKGINVTTKDLKKHLEKTAVGDVRYKNSGNARIRQTGKEFVMRSRFFSTLLADSMILSSKYSYRTSAKYILVVLCSLSRFVFLRSCFSLRHEFQKQAWTSIFKEMKEVKDNFEVSQVIFDGGSEFGMELQKWLKNSKGIKSNTVKRRPYRFSKGVGGVESAIRRIRNNLQKEMAKKNKGIGFKDILAKVQKTCNSQVLSSIRMSPKDALTQDPNYMAMLSSTIRYKRNKYLREEIKNNVEIDVMTVVQILKNQSKEFSGSRKESYGWLSPFFIVVDILRDREIKRYKLANMWTFIPLMGTYSAAEIKVSSLSYVEACEKEEKKINSIVSVKKDIVLFNIYACDRTFVGNKSIIDIDE